jgi:thioredoxin reductase (NADPH)
MENKKIAIIGSGIAGASAAIYLKRAGIDFSLFEAKATGGQLLFVEQVDNYIGLPLGMKGRELAQTISSTLEALKIDTIAEQIDSVSTNNNKVSLVSDKKTYIYDGLIVATGAACKTLNAKGESELSGKGVSYCAICDGFFYRNKIVAVVGGGNTAVEEALYLSGIAKKVYLIHRKNNLRAMEYLQKELHHKENIELVFDTVVESINGSNFVESLSVKNIKSGATKNIMLNGIFVAIGVAPATNFMKGCIDIDDGGFILTNEEMQSSSDIIWACGDCRKRPLRQLITAAAEGAIAAISGYKKIKGFYISA